MHDANAEVVDGEEHSDEEDLRPSFEKMKSKQATKHVQVGSDMLFRRRFREALTEFSKAQFLDPLRAEVFVLKAKCFEQFCDFKSSIANLRKAVRLNPEHAHWRRHLSIMVDAQGQSNIRMLSSSNVKNSASLLLVESLSYFTEAIEIEETIPEYWLHRCLTYIRLTRWRKALEDINQYIFLIEESIAELSNTSDFASAFDTTLSVTTGHDVSAATERKAAHEKRKQFNARLCDAFVMRAKLHWRLEIVTRAQSDLDRAHYLNPEHVEVQCLKRIIGAQNERIHQTTARLILGGKLKGALKELRAAIKLNPDDVQMLLLRAAVYRKLDCQQESLADIEAATVAHRDSVRLHHEMKKRNAGTGRNRARQLRREQEALRNARNGRMPRVLSPDAPRDKDIPEPVQITVMRNLTLNEAALNTLTLDPTASRGVFEKIIHSQQEIASKSGAKVDPLFFVNRGDSYATSGRWKEALKDYMQAYQMSPSGWEVRSRISLVYHKLGSKLFNERRYLEAVRVFTTAISHLNTVPEYYVARGSAYLEHKKYKLAHADFQQALTLDPNHRVALLRIMQFEPEEAQAVRFTNQLRNKVGPRAKNRPKVPGRRRPRPQTSAPKPLLNTNRPRPTTPWGAAMPPMKMTLRVKHSQNKRIRGMAASARHRRRESAPSGRPFTAVALPYVSRIRKR